MYKSCVYTYSKSTITLLIEITPYCMCLVIRRYITISP